MFRFMFCAEMSIGQAGEPQNALRSDSQYLSSLILARDILTASLFRAGTSAYGSGGLPGIENHLYLYYECRNAELKPEELFPALSKILELWPGENEKRRWIPMIDVYHASIPRSIEHWTRKAPVEERRGKLIRIQPQLLSSYIFYHFQLQEESKRTDNKYCMIGMHENILFYYDEMPPATEVFTWEGKLNSRNTPADWDSLMKPHFISWRDMPPQHERRYPMEALFSF